MQKSIITKILLGTVVSFYLFPFAFMFFPRVNTKMMLALVGVLIYVSQVLRNRKPLKKSLVVSCVLAFVFSFFCYLSTLLNNTDDNSYSRYFLTFFVWTFGAYGTCHFIRKEYGCVSLRTLVLYLAVVCAAQCLLAQLMSHFLGFRNFIDSFISQDQGYLHSLNRIYGIGASLDNAGVRFSFTLLLISYFIVDNIKNQARKGELAILSGAFIFITVFGNMIARTTTVGALLGIGYVAAVGLKRTNLNIRKNAVTSWLIIGSLVLGAIYLIAFFYSTDSAFKDNMRFAFEGFFNWVETGDFRTDSTDKLHYTMWVWPNDTETWIFGSGLFENWAFGTDIGYCRFILYCGLVGFSSFVLYFLYNTLAVARYYDDFVFPAFLLLVLALTIWIKVSTDIFQIYALLLCADGLIRDPEEDEDEEEEEEIPEPVKHPLPRR